MKVLVTALLILVASTAYGFEDKDKRYPTELYPINITFDDHIRMLTEPPASKPVLGRYRFKFEDFSLVVKVKAKPIDYIYFRLTFECF